MRPLLRVLQACLLLATGPALLSLAAAQPAPSSSPSSPSAPAPLPPPPPPPAGSGPAQPPAGPPPGAYPPGAYPPGAYPPGAYPPGAYPAPAGSGGPPIYYYPPPGASAGTYPYPVYYPPPAGSQAPYPPGYYPPGYYPPGAYPPGAYPPGAYPPGAYPPGYYPPPPLDSKPAAEKPRPKGYKEHDGFYLSFTPGFVLHNSTLKVEDTTAKASLSGLGTALDVAIGYTFFEGLVLGVAIGQQSTSVSVHNDNTSKDAGSTGTGYSSTAFLVDYYLNPKKGFHLQAMVGRGSLDVDSLRVGPIESGGVAQTVPVDSLTGIAGSLGIGLESFLSDEWSMGGLLRLDMASLSGGSAPGKTTATFVTPSLRLSITYH